MPSWTGAHGTVFVVVCRVGGIGLGAITNGAYFPFCQLKGQAFGIAYLVVGGIGGVMAIGGLFMFYRNLAESPAQSPMELQQVAA
jgi:hypothetical protein